jgi:hypothetical protein
MKCPHIECIKHEDCGILDITNKIPEKSATCSYSIQDKAKKNKDKGLGRDGNSTVYPK